MKTNSNLEDVLPKQESGEGAGRPTEADMELVEAFMPLLDRGFPEDDMICLILNTDGKEETLEFARRLRECKVQTRLSPWEIWSGMFQANT